MALEDFTTYTKVDDDIDISVIASTITVDTMRRDANSSVYYDYPVDIFGDFVHKVDFNWTAQTGGLGGLLGIWGVTTTGTTINDMLTDKIGLSALITTNSNSDFDFYLYDFDPVTLVSAKVDLGTTLPQTLYLTIQRNGTVLTCLLYSDSTRTTLVTSVSIACTTTKYLRVLTAYSGDIPDAYAATTMTATVSNLDLQFASAVTTTSTAGAFGVGLKARSSVVAPPTQQARKPYLSLKQSMREFFSAHVRWIKQSEQKESAFEKPYLSTDYPSMHFEIPTPDWPTTPPGKWPPGIWRPGTPPGGGARPVPGCPGCALYADPPLDCEHPVEIHSGIWCTNTPGAQTKNLTFMKTVTYTGNTTPIEQANRSIDYKVNGVSAGDTKLEIYAKKGAIKEITIGTWASIGVSAAVFVDSKIASHTICGSMVDGAGSNCMACVDVTCACDCATVTPMTLDAANTDSTIVAGGTATVTVLNGCDPFTWSVSGVGYVLDNYSTEGRSNKVTSVTGTCGTFAAYVAVTIVDNCGTSVTKNILNTAGLWRGYPTESQHDYGAKCTTSCNPIGEANCASDQATCAARSNVTTYVDGKRKWIEGSWVCGYCLSDVFAWCSEDGLRTTDLPPVYANPGDSKSDYGCYDNQAHCFCIVSVAQPYTWGC